jgi:hypothetical protein
MKGVSLHKLIPSMQRHHKNTINRAIAKSFKVVYMVGADFGPIKKVLNENNVCETNVINITAEKPSPVKRNPKKMYGRSFQNSVLSSKRHHKSTRQNAVTTSLDTV